MEIFFYGMGVFCVFAIIGTNFYFLHLLKCLYASMYDNTLQVSSIKDNVHELRLEVFNQSSRIQCLQDEIQHFRNESMILEKDLCAKQRDFVETINVLNNKIEDYHDDIKKKQESEVRKNNWDSVREAFTRVNPKIQIQERN